jgi:ribonuclease BN (tRNA processing enzyme)
MRLTVVGCAGSFPHAGSAASSYLLEAEDGGRTWRVVLDLGNGASGPLHGYCDPGELDALAISHLHSDHVADVVVLNVYLRYHPEGARGPIRLLAPSGTSERLAAIAGSDPATDTSAQFALEHWSEGRTVIVGPFEIEPIRVNHPVEAYGMRITGPAEDGGRAVLAYTGDTDDCPALDRLAAGADLLLSEAAFLEGGPSDEVRGVHLTGLRAGQVAARNGVERLVLTHLAMWNEDQSSLAEARSAYSGPIELAAPGAVFSI